MEPAKEKKDPGKGGYEERTGKKKKRKKKKGLSDYCPIKLMIQVRLAAERGVKDERDVRLDPQRSCRICSSANPGLWDCLTVTVIQSHGNRSPTLPLQRVPKVNPDRINWSTSTNIS